ncbi:MAG: adenylate/guanylate cyclase domain-containing protein [Casimicrobiaceae bacterium]
MSTQPPPSTPNTLVDAPKSSEPTRGRHPDFGRANRYVAGMLQQHLVDDPGSRGWIGDGTAVFVDVSGFTKLSEQLARKGREGAEQITELIGRIFESMLAVAYEHGGSLIKFGGDALLLWFDGDDHAARACRATVLMRRVLSDVGRIDLPEARMTLRMTQAVHAGRFHFFAVGSSHLELLATGPEWSRLVAIQHAAEADEILVSAETAAALPGECLGEAKGPGLLLKREPPGTFEKIPLRPLPQMAPETVTRCLPAAIRGHVLGPGGSPEHRPVTIAFIRFEGADALIERDGPTAAAEALHRLVSVVAAAAEEHEVAFLGSDVDADGGKLILTAGAPRVTGDDEERMLLALRKIVESDLPMPIRIGVHRGAVFAGDIGPAYRRTYTVMGDAVNLAARLMAGAQPGQIYATADVLDRSKTTVEKTELAPLVVKGKAEPVKAWSVGRAQSSKARQVSSQRLPLTGRNAELGVIRKAFASARSGAGRLVEVVGDSGIGKTRLLEALRDAATGLNTQHATCEAYTASTPYAVWSELLREYLNFGRDDPEVVIVERLREEVAKNAPDLTPWLPLIAIALGLEVAPTPEVSMLAEANRRAKMHESLVSFLAAIMPKPQLIEIENAHHMDKASAELLSFLTGEIGAHPWLFAVARQGSTGFVAPATETVVRLELKPLAPPDALRLAQLATQQTPLAAHVLEVVAARSGGNPQFLRDLLQRVVVSGGIADLPDSAEAATMATIDSLAPEDRAVVRHAAVFGLTFHPRMLAWFAEEGEFAQPEPAAWDRLRDLFDEEPDGYLRFRRSLLRDAAYESLPYRLRRKLHGAVAARLEEEMDFPDEAGGILSLHYFEASEYRPAWRYATLAAKRAEGDYAYIEAAKLYSRAVEAGKQIDDLAKPALAAAHEALGDAWYKAGEFQKASAAFATARELAAGDALADATRLIKLSRVEEKLGRYPEALRWVERAREALAGVQGSEAARQNATASVWYATVLQAAGRTEDALRWAEQGAREAEEVDDPGIAGDAYMVMGWGHSVLGKEGGEALMLKSLEAHRRSGNRVRQANILSNLGSACYWDGRWDDAMVYYERGRDEMGKVGDTLNAAVASLGIAEVLSDRGELAEAELTLQKTVPVWKASEYHYFLGYCIWMLGRVSLRGNKVDEARARFAEARTLLSDVGAEHEVLDIDARLAECHLLKREPEPALALADAILAKPDSSGAIARLTPLLYRIRGYAMLMQGDPWGAREAFETSLTVARERKEHFEIALTLNALIELDRLEGVEPPQEVVDESRAAIANLKIRALPAAPVIG